MWSGDWWRIKWTLWSGVYSILTSCNSKIKVFLYEFSQEAENLLPQNRCFVRSFRQISLHFTKWHACHGICIWTRLRAALPMRLIQKTQKHVICCNLSYRHGTVLPLRPSVGRTSTCHKVPSVPRKTKLRHT